MRLKAALSTQKGWQTYNCTAPQTTIAVCTPQEASKIELIVEPSYQLTEETIEEMLLNCRLAS